jgi:hypothetical protein
VLSAADHSSKFGIFGMRKGSGGEQVIGAGASSQVRKAADLRCNSFVALKVISVKDESRGRTVGSQEEDVIRGQRLLLYVHPKVCQI